MAAPIVAAVLAAARAALPRVVGWAFARGAVAQVIRWALAFLGIQAAIEFTQQGGPQAVGQTAANVAKGANSLSGAATGSGGGGGTGAIAFVAAAGVLLFLINRR